MPTTFKSPIAAFLLAIAIAGVSALTCQAAEYRFFHEGVLGTSLEIQVSANSQDAAKKAEESVLESIDRLDSVFSTYSSQSELAGFLSRGQSDAVQVSPALYSAIQVCEEWTRASKGAFNPAVELLTRKWAKGEQEELHPNDAEIRAAVSKIGSAHWRLDASTRSVSRNSDVPISLNAVAKGIILDHAAESALETIEGLQGLMVNIGGDLRVAGSFQTQVDIANPGADSIGSRPLASIMLSQGAVATSGSSERHFTIDGKLYSHIIDPRTGYPVEQTVSATVIADTACSADAVATICSVLSVQESLAFVNGLPGVDCLLVTAANVLFMSDNWPADAKPADTTTEEKADADTKAGTNVQTQQPKLSAHEMLVQFEIGKPEQSRRYRRPYVAVWIEDKDAFPVKTLSLFLMQDNPGPRWYRDVRRWYSDDQLRKLVDDRDLIATVSKPTRNPGKYKVTWDGRDDSGAALKPGKYTLLIESAREHGSYELIKHDFELGKEFSADLKGNVEIASASVQYKVNQAAGE
ncbi:DUF2271 domain-containing protein [Rubripirellula reticaptiva]|uniref:FAD:protein FMN transferase n=1 Tax=Rubripirellula reticaptiva TaxID=2528013 RepID=A0A5C6EK54_9BACT|nr:DUF2271 domain-containing protein [Rubripirellula reticaptiva]TWU48006.1 Thiamine biosynthesis lipoprotein ApbE precursor [Rubripirellula reticaptiva]